LQNQFALKRRLFPLSQNLFPFSQNPSARCHGCLPRSRRQSMRRECKSAKSGD
jgi:hypothetical protein